MSVASSPARSGTLKIGIVAGEASGDALAAELIMALRARCPRASFVGIAGPRMQAAGCEAWFPQELLAVRGLVEVIGRLPQLVRVRRALARRLVAEGVRVFVGVDAPDFNLGLERRLKRRGVRTIHFVSPSVWAWRRERIKRIADSVDRMLALFPFEPPLYEASGVKVTYVGHPLARTAATAASRRIARARLQTPRGVPIFALLPGSRVSELDMHADLLVDTIDAVLVLRPDAHFLVPLGTRATRDRFELALFRRPTGSEHVTMLYGHATDALRAADVGIVASGTATLEAALARCPHVIFYRLHPLTARWVRSRLLLPWVGLPNVLANRFVVPELLQEHATPDNLAQAALNMYDDVVTRGRVESLFATLAHDLQQETGALAASALVAEIEETGQSC